MVPRLPEVPPPFPGRPLFVNYDGGRLYISVHDRYHLERLREWKRKIRNAHPDRNRRRFATAQTRNLLKARNKWQEQEMVWYAKFKLEPPAGSRRRQSSSSELLLSEGKAA